MLLIGQSVVCDLDLISTADSECFIIIYVITAECNDIRFVPGKGWVKVCVRTVQINGTCSEYLSLIRLPDKLQGRRQAPAGWNQR